MLIFIQSQMNSQNNLLDIYQRLASSYCSIHDYPAWLRRQTTLNYLLELAQIYNINSDRIEQEIKQYRLQRECLKLMERLPIFVGSG
jgi:hypothetical protein